jgi:hypothetical protein
MPRLDVFRKPTTGLGDDFQGTNDGIEGPLVGCERLEVQTIDEPAGCSNIIEDVLQALEGLLRRHRRRL